MKNIFENNNYKFGVESFLLMYLDQYQFVLGYDLESYSKSNETFTKDNPCNIYFVLKRPKVTVDPNSVKIDGKKVNLDLLVHDRDGGTINVAFELKKAKSDLKFTTGYPYNLFFLSDKDDILLGARPSTLMDSYLVGDNINTPILDYEILYIGQAYGKDGKRTAIERLSSHETLQKIYTHSHMHYPDSDIWIMLANFSQQSMLFSAGSDLIKVKEEDKKIEDEKAEHMFKNKGLLFTEKQKINFTEAALIKYFEPKYNIEFKDSFPNMKHKSYSECYSLDVRSITIELETSEMIRRIYTEKTGRKIHHLKTFDFSSDNDRISLLNLD